MRMIDERVPPCQDVIDRRKLKAGMEMKKRKVDAALLTGQSVQNLRKMPVLSVSFQVDTTGSIRSMIGEFAEDPKS